MPGPGYDSECGTSSNAASIGDAIDRLYDRVSDVLGGRDHIYIGALTEQADERTTAINATLSEWEWRIIRFALVRARGSII